MEVLERLESRAKMNLRKRKNDGVNPEATSRLVAALGCALGRMRVR